MIDAFVPDHDELWDIEEIEKIHDLVLDAFQRHTALAPDGNLR